MKLHKSLFVAFLVMLMTIFSCSEESVLTANAEREIGNADDSEIKLTVEIAAPITRTVRPEIAKYTVELQIDTSNNEESGSYKTVISRTLNAHNTSTTFTNISVANYKVVVSGYDKDNNKILEGTSKISETDFGSSNLLSQVEVTDYFDNNSDKKGSIIFNLYGLEDFYTEGTSITMKLTKAGSSEISTGNNNNSSDSIINETSNSVTLNYSSENKIFSSADYTINSGSYIITCENSLDLNLVQDPLVNIYAGATTEINWIFNYDKGDVSSDTTLKNIKIPVWKVPVKEDYRNPEVINAVGYISANALFAEPTFIGAVEYVSSAYDSDNNLWILTLDSSNGTYKLTNINQYDSASENKQKATYSLSFSSTSLKDFTFTQVDGSEKTLFLAEATDNNSNKSNKTVSIWSLDKSSSINNEQQQFTQYNVFGIDNTSDCNFTAVTANGNEVYIVASYTNVENQHTVGVYKGDLSSSGRNSSIAFSELAVAADNGEETETLGADLIGRFSNNNFTIPTCFRVTDMYFDDSALYITAGALCLNISSGNSSFGGLFKYTVNGSSVTYSGDTGAAGSMVKNEYSNVLSVPRCIVPVENALYIVDSGFCGTVDETTSSMNVTGKCNRICVINDKNKLGEFKITDLHDSADFDFSDIMNAFNTNNEYCWSF